MITGTLFIRGVNKQVDNRKLVMVFGVIALPDNVELTEEKLYLTTGEVEKGKLVLNLDTPRDPPFDILGWRADQILTSAIWRV